MSFRIAEVLAPLRALDWLTPQDFPIAAAQVFASASGTEMTVKADIARMANAGTVKARLNRAA
ncbi:MAG: hypothetical protein AAFO68_05275, partial [Pseudomonadota bacterium]